MTDEPPPSPPLATPPSDPAPPAVVADESTREQTARPAIGSEWLAKILALIHNAFGHDLSQYKPGTIERRIDRRMAVHRIEQVGEYVELLQDRPAELATLHHDLLIGVTGFFRDTEPFEALRTQVLPALLDKRPAGSAIRVWVPGCSTGEEAYSIAMVLLEHLGARAREHKLQIFATDVDNAAVQTARRGFYRRQLTTGLSPERLQRFFVPRPGGFQVSRTIRDLIVFATQNVTTDPPFSRLDLVSCRNLLIYLQPPLQKQLLRIFHYALAPEGYLLLGTSESVGDSADLFALLDRRCKLYRKKNITPHVALDVNPGESDGAARGAEMPARAPPDARPVANFQRLADRRVLDRYAPPGVLINEQFEVMQFRGRTGPYLEPLPGVASLNLLELARPELVADVRAAVHRALETNAAVTTRGVSVEDGTEPRTIDVEVLPVAEPESTARCLVVLFVEASEAGNLGANSAVTGGDAGGGESANTPQGARVEGLERELAATRQYLHAAIAELETSNEELKSANEELQSANEELQSTNEELETSKEELQSTNEELTTVNDELHRRMGELGQSNGDR